LAITCLTSALTRNQVISFILSVVICFFLILCGWEPVTRLIPAWAAGIMKLTSSFSVMPHFAGFQRGIIDSRDLLFFLSVIGLSLFCNGVVIRNLRSG
jgi:ABC-2 type transport system permease protein